MYIFGIIYRGRIGNMKRILVVKAMVLGTIACSISAIGFGAGVESTHIPDATNMQQSTQGTENMMPCNPTGWTVQILRLVHNQRWGIKYL